MYIIIIIYSWKLLSNARVHSTRRRWEKYKYIHTSSIRIHSTIWIWIWIGIWNCASITKAFFLFIIAFYCIHYDKLGDSQVDVFSFIDIIKFLFFAFCFVFRTDLSINCILIKRRSRLEFSFENSDASAPSGLPSASHNPPSRTFFTLPQPLTICTGWTSPLSVPSPLSTAN